MGWLSYVATGRNKAGQQLVRAICSCGRVKELTEDNIKRGRSKSCGCLRVSHKQSRINNGKPASTYVSWQAMKSRCLNPNAADYVRYGARGITIDPKWLDFANFLADMGERPSGHTLDRIDPNGGYNKFNCRWANYKLQRANQRPHRRSVK